MMNGRTKKQGPRRVPGLLALGSWYYFSLLFFLLKSFLLLLNYTSIDSFIQETEAYHRQGILDNFNKLRYTHTNPTAIFSRTSTSYTLPHPFFVSLVPYHQFYYSHPASCHSPICKRQGFLQPSPFGGPVTPQSRVRKQATGHCSVPKKKRHTQSERKNGC